MNLHAQSRADPMADTRAADRSPRRHLRRLLASAGSALAVVLEVLLGLAGLDLAVTGAAGHCLLYQRLGHVPARLRRTS